ncbi:hypothetical protein BC829DRAFT_249804 [Chytridium lagenaria]|nr:hypothetical protein BC829DRAFT_249804 [Chytridium lagenaria]
MQLQFKSEVKAVKLRMDRMIIVFWNRVVVYTFSPRPRRLHTFETMRNDRGLVSLSPSPLAGVGGRPNTAVLAFLGRMVGQVQICELQLGPIADPIPGAASRNPSTTTPSKATSSSSSPPHPSNTRNSPLVIAPPSPLPNPPISIIAAHTSGLSCFTVSHSGHLIATASETGTLIRVFETRSGRLINELRRGLDRAEIFCIAFNLEGTRLCVSSDKGTIHVFNVTGAQHSSPAHQPMQNTDPAVGASMVAAQMAYPLGGSTPGGMVIDGLGGNSIPTSPSMTGSPPYASGRPAAASPSMRPGNVPPLSPYAQSASPIPTSSSTRSSSNLPRGASPSIQASSPSTTSSSSSTFTSGLTNRLSTLSFFSPLSKYFSSEWSFAQFSLPVEAKCICAFAASDRADDGPASAARRAVDAVRAGPGNLAPAPPPPPPTKALYFDFKTGTATSTLPGTSAPPAQQHGPQVLSRTPIPSYVSVPMDLSTSFALTLHLVRLDISLRGAVEPCGERWSVGRVCEVL